MVLRQKQTYVPETTIRTCNVNAHNIKIQRALTSAQIPQRAMSQALHTRLTLNFVSSRSVNGSVLTIIFALHGRKQVS